MKMKDKPLSEKATLLGVYFYVKDVAEAVAELKNLKTKEGYYIFHWDDTLWILKEIDKIFGTFNSPQKESDSSVVKTQNLRGGLVSPKPEGTSNSKGCECGHLKSAHGGLLGRSKKTPCWKCPCKKFKPKCQEKQDVCANCGHEKWEHQKEFGGDCEHDIFCKCEKFKKEQEDE